MSHKLHVAGLDSATTTEDLHTIFSNYGTVIDCAVVYDKYGSSRKFGFVAYDSLAAAKVLLDGTSGPIMIHGVVVDIMPAADNEVETKENSARARPAMVSRKLGTLAAQPKTKKAGRLIVRNLSFDTSQKHLQKVFGTIGALQEVHVPRKEGKPHPGFAFVQFEKVDDASKAVEALNGKKMCGRAMIVDYAFQKNVFEQYKGVSLEHKAAEKPNVAVKRRREESDDEEIVAEVNVDEEVKRMKQILCDDENQLTEVTRASEKDDDKPQKKRRKQEEGQNSAAKPAKDQKKTKEKDEKERDGKKDDVADDGDDDDGDMSEADDDEKKTNNKFQCGRDLDEGKTVFIRNVPYDADWKDVKTGFQKYGTVSRVYLCKSSTQTDGSHKGTGFVKFKDTSGQTQALEEEAKIKEKMRQLGFKDQKTPLEGFGVMVKGRRIFVMNPTKPEEAPGRKEAKRAERIAQKESWAHLLNMGMIDEWKHPEKWALLSKAEKRLRQASQKERKFQINDPNYVVNPLRLSIRNLDLQVDNPAIVKALKSQGIKAQKVTLVRSKDRKDASGARRPLGYAFAEFEKHDTAHDALKYLNNNAEAFSSYKRPIVEFVLEDKRKLRILENCRNLVQKRKEELEKKQDKENVDKAGETTEKIGDKTTTNVATKKLRRAGDRGRKQRENRRVRKEKAAQEDEIKIVKKDFLKKVLKERAEKTMDPEMERAMYVSRPKKEKKQPKNQLHEDFEATTMSKWRNG
eukprot:GEMP01024384.1.p1 GENE.GEMP01024384.1~~GEMP01024384.1.p1  ORF type:complete len:742 (+),score=187.74 GEMP01024384.1:133-2358(+)